MTNDFPLQLTEHRCDVHHGTSHWVGGIKAFPDGHKVDAQPPQLFNQGDCCLLERGKIDAPEPMIEEVRNEMQELVRAQKNVERFLQRKRTPPRKHRPAKRIPPRRVPSWETSSAVFLVYIAVLRRNAPVTRIFSLRSFRVLQRAKACTAGSGTYIPHRKTTVCIEVWQ